jgi:hypothetical protein
MGVEVPDDTVDSFPTDTPGKMGIITSSGVKIVSIPPAGPVVAPTDIAGPDVGTPSLRLVQGSGGRTREQTVRERFCRQARIRIVKDGRPSHFTVRCGKPWCPECADGVKADWDYHLKYIWEPLKAVWVGSFQITTPTLSGDPLWVCLSGRIAERKALYLRFPLDDGTQHVFADRDLGVADDSEISFRSVGVSEARGLFLDLLARTPPEPVMAQKPRGSRVWGMTSSRASGGGRKIFEGVHLDQEEAVQQMAEEMIWELHKVKVDLSLDGDAAGIPDDEVVRIVQEAAGRVEAENEVGW